MIHFFKILILFATILLFSCRGDEPKRIPDTVPDILGNITSVEEMSTDDNKTITQLQVEALEGVETPYPKASIRVDKNTLIESKKGKRIKAAQLQQGQQVEVWFEGAVMESMPVQATAKAVRVNIQP